MDVTDTERRSSSCRLPRNRLGDDGTITICKALSESKVSKLQELDLSLNDIGPPGGEALGNMLLVRTSLTSIDLSFNDMGGSFYVKPEALSGSPLEEGTKVHYQGQEVTILQEEDDNVRARPSVEEIRSGSGFIDGRPPDDIDKLMTFSFSEVPLTGQVLLGLGGLLFVLLAGFLVFS